MQFGSRAAPRSLSSGCSAECSAGRPIPILRPQPTTAGMTRPRLPCSASCASTAGSASIPTPPAAAYAEGAGDDPSPPSSPELRLPPLPPRPHALAMFVVTETDAAAIRCRLRSWWRIIGRRRAAPAIPRHHQHHAGARVRPHYRRLEAAAYAATACQTAASQEGALERPATRCPGAAPVPTLLPMRSPPPALPRHVGPWEFSILGAMVAVRCPQEIRRHHPAPAASGSLAAAGGWWSRDVSAR